MSGFESLGFAWPVKPCRLQDSLIHRVEGVGVITTYNPFKEEQLYLKFAGVDADNETEIFNFVNKYGFLGVNEDLNHYFSRWNLDRSHEIKTIESIDGGIEREAIRDIRSEIVLFRNLIQLWSFIKAEDFQGILSQVNKLPYPEFPTISKRNIEEDAHTFAGILTDEITIKAAQRLSDWLEFKLLLAGETATYDHATRRFKSSWKVPNLLTALYQMFYFDVTNGITLRKCKNETCGRFFPVYGSDERKIYCNDSCTKAQGQRDFRRREKARRLFEAGYGLEEISAKTSLTPDEINTVINTPKKKGAKT